MCAAYLCSASIASAVDVEWYLESARAATGWKVEAVGLRLLALASTVPSACGAMIAGNKEGGTRGRSRCGWEGQVKVDCETVDMDCGVACVVVLLLRLVIRELFKEGVGGRSLYGILGGE